MKPRRVTLRARLTVIYGGLFLVAGILLLGVTYTLFNRRLTQSPRFISLGLKDGDKQTFAFTGDGRMLTGPDASRWLDEQQNLLREAASTALLTQGGIALALVAGAAVGLGWLVAGRVLAPLHRVTDTARRIAAAPAADRGLRERIALRGRDDEVRDLAVAFDTMVERLDRSFDGQRRFVANASHELRTPLTLGRSLVELAMHRTSASTDVRELGEHLLDINSRQERLIAGLLLLAKSDSEVTGRLPVDLADVITHVVAQTAAEAARAEVTVHESAAESITTGDAVLLERLVHNLMENGIRHNVAGGWVRITSRGGAGRVELEVRNTGPVVPPDEASALCEPFRRRGTGRGVGLGLSIVQSVARAHGGQVEVGSRPGGGLIVTVILPGDGPG